MVLRGARSASDISYDWMPYLHSYNGAIFKDEKNGDFTVTLNSPEAKQALDMYVELAKTAGPPNPGSYGQAQVIQALRDRQGGARDAGDRRLVADGRSDQVRGGREDGRRRPAARSRRPARAHARAFHRRDPEERPEGPPGAPRSPS